ncbi:MAG: hypothetical protein K940chlam9_00938 [Chlamydiae bacterium]|nr:hypothetical protein [Chlamydiota bacterium]
MEVSSFLAKFFGLYLLIVGVFYLARRTYIQEVVEEFFSQKALVIVSGTLNVMIGLLIILAHNVWVFSWPLIITLLGYLTLFKGLTRLFVPLEREKALAEKILKGKNPLYIGVVALLLGLLLTCNGFR